MASCRRPTRSHATVLVTLAQQVRQLSDVSRKAPRLVFAEELADDRLAGLSVVLEVAELLPGAVLHDETRTGTLARLGRWKTATG